MYISSNNILLILYYIVYVYINIYYTDYTVMILFELSLGNHENYQNSCITQPACHLHDNYTAPLIPNRTQNRLVLKLILAVEHSELMP